MKYYLIACVSLVGCSPHLTDERASSRTELIQESKCADYPGSIYTQARIDGIDYRPILIEAINFNEESLSKLFEMNFMGEGGETHSQNLLNLLVLWGDQKFSDALRKKPHETRDLVISLIDHAWFNPKWSDYPKTLDLSPNSIMARKNA